MRAKNIISEVIVFILILVWAFTFASKIFDFDTFNRQIKGAHLLSSGGSILPYALQAIHLGLIIMLLNKKWKKIGLLTSFCILSLYTGYLVYILKFAPSIPCSCIAVFRGMNWNDQLYFNFSVLAINIIGLVAFFSQRRTPHSVIQTT
jgi:hypothetical protein